MRGWGDVHVFKKILKTAKETVNTKEQPGRVTEQTLMCRPLLAGKPPPGNDSDAWNRKHPSIQAPPCSRCTHRGQRVEAAATQQTRDLGENKALWSGGNKKAASRYFKKQKPKNLLSQRTEERKGKVAF